MRSTMPLRKQIAFDSAKGYRELLGGSETVGPNRSAKNAGNEMRIQFTGRAPLGVAVAQRRNVCEG